jgi:hypothetical protein
MRYREKKFGNKENELEQNIAELKEWQDNQYNPGYHIGSGRIRKPISNLSRYPLVFLILGIMGVVYCVFQFFKTQSLLSDLPGLIFSILISICFIYGGIARLKQK